MKRTETTEGGHSCPPRKVGTIPTEIGTIAADWRIAPLDAVCEPPQYGFTASAEAKGKVRFLRITDITDSGVKWPTVPFCECPEKEFGKYRLAPGDIVFARIGATTGKSYLITNPPPSVFASAELKKALLHKLFTEGLRGEPQKQTEIGPVPESWDIRALGDHLTEAQYGISIKGAETGRYPVLRMTNQKQGQISGANLQYVDLSPVQLEKFRVDRQDILFNRTNSLELVGRTAIFDLEGDFVFASYLIRLWTDAARIRPFFLNHYFNWDETQVRLKSIATRAVSQSNISATRLKCFPVPVPSPEEQDKIVTRIDCVDRKRSVHHRKHAVLTALFRTLLHQLMTAQIRVQEIDLEGLLAQPVAQMDSKS